MSESTCKHLMTAHQYQRQTLKPVLCTEHGFWCYCCYIGCPDCLREGKAISNIEEGGEG